MEQILSASSALFLWLVDYTRDISILICLIFLFKLLAGKKLPAWWHYCIWLILLARMVIPWEFKNLFDMPSLTQVPVNESLREVIFLDEEILMPVVNSSVSSSGQAWNISFCNILLLSWSICAVIFGAYVLIKNFRFLISIKNEPLLTDNKTLGLLEACKKRLNISKDPKILITDKVKSPSLFGYFQPRLLLPEGVLEKLNNTDLTYIFMHELGHIKHHDVGISWLMTFLQIIHWFNPLVWFAFHRIKIDQESACDEYVLSQVTQNKSIEYAKTIIDFLDKFCRNRRIPAMVGILEKKSQIKRRIAMIINFKRYSLKRTYASILMLFIIGLLFFTSSSGKANAIKTEIAGEFKETQVSGSINRPVLSRIENKVFFSENEKKFREEIDITPAKEIVKDTVMKEKAEIILAKVDTKNVNTQVDPLILTTYKKQDAFSGNKKTELEERESEPGLVFSEVVQPRKNSSVNYNSRGLSRLKKGQIDDAITDFNKAIELKPKSAASFISRGIAYYMQGQIDKAIADYNKAIEINPEFAAAYQKRGYAYHLKGEYAKAISDYNRAIEINPEFAAAYQKRGYTYCSLEKFDNAFSDYNKAIGLNPEDAATYNMRGVAYYKRGQIDKAISDYNKAIEIDPKFAAAYQNRGYSYHSKDRYKKAISDYNKVIDFDPENFNAYILRGHAYHLKRRYTDAILNYTKALELNPEAAVANKYRDLARRRILAKTFYSNGLCSYNIEHHDKGHGSESLPENYGQH